ncbi:MAG: TrmH family RNA methyltransferase [Alkalibacterium gilvum]|uniref:RNA methyltransferase, TrmH family n=1 Tax=Alkalibacterium gilvum TaxID=1130080 RepID=A0A1H6RHZ0_9LACT|nr:MULTISPECIES: RNA methyltransferase [Alkalibacterium]MDN6194493.1 RNA methyltransferase [Alkalibacterium sp.]MDN6294552.1 RNA methyltransferase [Alkalibacterium sp.]MDN6295760.1 RNA methyltransferase [Alkalibacterium sp.]MDN6398516.1 RNA methyltransferase [Alkalibacterium sp.]MDN6728939.1 RNA methyltransferase [Alkalibacterium sp.]
MEIIESTQNKRVKEWKKLLTRKGRRKQEKYLIESPHLVEEAIKFEADIEVIIVRKDKVEEYAFIYEQAYSDVLVVTKEISNSLSDSMSGQGILAVIKITEPAKTLTGDKPILLLDEVQDPGNLGTLIRTADAAGFEGVILGEGTVDLYNAKTLRSTQGSHFHISVLHGDIHKWIPFLSEKNIPIYGTALDERAISFRSIEPQERFGLIVGNEGNGVNASILKKTTENLYIPIKGQAESLNVAIAASILMFDIYR